MDSKTNPEITEELFNQYFDLIERPGFLENIREIVKYPVFDPNKIILKLCAASGSKANATKDVFELISLYLTNGSSTSAMLKKMNKREADRAFAQFAKYRIADPGAKNSFDVITLPRLSAAFPYVTCELLDKNEYKRPVPKSVLAEARALGFPAVLTSMSILSVLPKCDEEAADPIVLLAKAGSICYAFLESRMFKKFQSDQENWEDVLKWAKIKQNSTIVSDELRKFQYKRFETSILKNKADIRNLVKYSGISCNLEELTPLMYVRDWLSILNIHYDA